MNRKAGIIVGILLIVIFFIYYGLTAAFFWHLFFNATDVIGLAITSIIFFSITIIYHALSSVFLFWFGKPQSFILREGSDQQRYIVLAIMAVLTLLIIGLCIGGLVASIELLIDRPLKCSSHGAICPVISLLLPSCLASVGLRMFSQCPRNW